MTSTPPEAKQSQPLQHQPTEKGAAINQALGAMLFQHCSDAVMITDNANIIVDINPAFSRITGYHKHEVLGLPAGFMKSGLHDKAFYQQMWLHLTKAHYWQGEIWDIHRDGHLFPKDVKISCYRTAEGEISHFVAVFSDSSEKQNHKRQLEKLAYYDQLTGLPNRTLLLETLERRLESANKQPGRKAFSIAFLDIDNFKSINDSRGHLFGDQLIKAVAQRLIDDLDPSCVMGRISGDEFLLIFSEQHNVAKVEQIVQHFGLLLQQPFYIEGIHQHVNLSIGVSSYPQDGIESKSLIAKADIAMYLAKNGGGSHYRHYNRQHGEHFFQQFDIAMHLPEAIRQGQIYPHFQPKIALQHGNVTGCEVLARWRRKSGDLVSPLEFITVAEKNAQINALSHSLWQQACSAFAVEQGGHVTSLAFNVSAQQLLETDFASHFIQQIQLWGLEPTCCEIELTESAFIDNFTLAKACIDRLRQAGVKVAIDDFGTGFSSLSYLRNLQVDVIKLDRAFVLGIDDGNVNNVQVVKYIIELAHSLGMKVVAEGVETLGQVAVLKQLGCDEAQGFLFAPALSWPDLKRFVREFSPDSVLQIQPSLLPQAVQTLLN